MLNLKNWRKLKMTGNKTEKYLRKRYEETHWPYHSLNGTKFEIGESFADDIKDLRDRGMVKPTSGLNGWMIEILHWNTKWTNKNTDHE